MADFPIREDFMENGLGKGYDKDPLGDAEGIATGIYGQPLSDEECDSKDHKNAKLTCLHAGGPRESRRLLGDVVLTEETLSQTRLPDGCVPRLGALTALPQKAIRGKVSDNPFIAYAVHG